MFWHKIVFGHLDEKLKKAIYALDLDTKNIEADPSLHNWHGIKKLHWAQKFCLDWERLGDYNTLFFRLSATIREKKNNISTLERTRVC